MKRCGHCQRLNREEDLVCILCNTSLADAEIVPDTDATEDWWRVCRGRRERVRREAILPALFYVATVGGMASVMTYFTLRPAIPYLVGGAVVGVGVCLGWWEGRFRLAFLQAAASTIAIACFGPVNSMTPFVFAGHVISAMFLGIWLEFIRGV